MMNKDITAQSPRSKAVQDALDGKIRGFRGLLPFLGPAFIAAIAYIDPGNFATNISAGSKYGYMLLWVILFSNIMALLIQSLSAKLGIATGKNLPEVAREEFPKPVSIGLWIQGELVIIATDLAEFIGAALGLYLLFGIPMLEASIIAAIGSFAILELQRRGYRSLEAGIAGMLFVVVIAFALQTFFAKPDAVSVMKAFLSRRFMAPTVCFLQRVFLAQLLCRTPFIYTLPLHSGGWLAKLMQNGKKSLGLNLLIF